MKKFFDTMEKDLHDENFDLHDVVMAHVAVLGFVMLLGFAGWLESVIF